MKLLKFFIYSILIVFVIWISLIAAGPSLIQQVFKAYFKDQIELKEISISPRLDVQIGIIEFGFQNSEEKLGLAGQARSLQLNWSLFSPRPSLRFKIGPTELDGLIKFNNLSINISTNSIFDFSGHDLVSSIKFLEVDGWGNADAVHFNGSAHNIWHRYKSPTFRIVNLNSRFASSAMVTGSFDVYDLKQFPQSQINNFFINSGSVSSDILEIRGSQLNIRGKNETGLISLNTKLNQLVSFDDTFSFGKFQNKLNLDLKKRSIAYPIVFYLNDFALPGSSLTGEAQIELNKLDDSNFRITSEGHLNNIEIKNKNAFFGKVDTSSFKSSASFDFLNNILQSNFTLDVKEVPLDQLKAVVDVKTNFEEGINLLACFRGTKCSIGDSELFYRLVADDQSAFGKSSCNLNTCTPNDFVTEIETINTLKLFENLSQSGILSPVSIGYIFTLLLSGETKGSGHKIKF